MISKTGVPFRNLRFLEEAGEWDKLNKSFVTESLSWRVFSLFREEIDTSGDPMRRRMPTDLL